MRLRKVKKKALSTMTLGRSLSALSVDHDQKREVFRQTALNAWNNFRQSGRYVDASDADAWLAELERGIDCKFPTMHSKTIRRALNGDQISFGDFMRASPLFGADDVEFVRDHEDFVSRLEFVDSDLE